MHYRWHRLTAIVSAIFGWTIYILAWNVSGTVIDETGEHLAGASMRLLTAKDSAFVAGCSTDAQGQFMLTNINNGRYILQTRYLGYDDQYTSIKIASANVAADTIRLGGHSILLDGVSVTGIKTPIKVMEDTVEFNADSYHSAPNAVVEDLLRRLPGVEVDSNGKITANGKEVTKILVDGKEFFADDPKVASKSLPVNMVDKLQVVDRKSDQARLTGVDDGEEETVINLTVKKGMKNGYFGNVEGGYGTDHRYMGSFNINRFWNDNQVTLLGNLNNINQSGFTDSNGSRFRQFGGTSGINSTQALGVNFNVGKEEILRIGGNIIYTHSSRNTERKRLRTYLFPDSTSLVNGYNLTRDRSKSIRADLRLQWKPDSFNTLDIRPTLSYSLNHSSSTDTSQTSAGNQWHTPVTASATMSASNGHAWDYGIRAIYNHNFRHHRGRSFSLSLDYSHSDVKEDIDSWSRDRFFLLSDSIDLTDRFTDQHTWSNRLQGRITWTEPIGNPLRGNYLQIAYNTTYRWNNSDRLVYDRLPRHWTDLYNQTLELVNDSLSNLFRNNYFSQDIRVGYRHVSKTHNIDVGLSLVPQSSSSHNITHSERTIPSRHVFNFSPYLRYRLKVGKQRSLMLNYRGRSSQPTMAQLQPVADATNPLKVIIGNPSLNPTFTHYLRLRFQDFDAKSQRSIMTMADVQMAQNSIVSSTVYNRFTGGDTTTYRNVNGVWSARLMGMYSQPLRNKAWQISAHTFAMADRRVGFNNGIRNASTAISWSIMPAMRYSIDLLQLELRPNYSLQHTANSLPTVTDMTIHNYGGTFTGLYTAPFGLTLSSDITFTGTSGYTSGYDKREWMWNAQVSYSMLRDRSLTLSLKAYDLLQQKSNISRTVTANYIDDTRYNDLTRYFMITVAYKFNTFGKGNQPTDRNAPNFRGMGPPPPGLGRPSGPPPM